MSLPSVKALELERGRTSAEMSAQERTELLVEAMRRDLGPALAFLHKKAHEADATGRAIWDEDPASPLGKMLIRIHAGKVLRRLASEHFCHGKKLTFFNCCRGIVGEELSEEEEEQMQIESQNGVLGHADC